MTRRKADRGRAGPEQISNLFGGRDRMLDQLSQSASDLEPFLRAWNNVVPNPACNFTHPAYYKDGRLTVWVRSPVWANWVRHRQNLIMDSIHSNGLPGVSSLAVQLVPESRTSSDSERINPSPGASRTVEQSARTVKDPELRESLERLAETLKRSDR